MKLNQNMKQCVGIFVMAAMGSTALSAPSFAQGESVLSLVHFQPPIAGWDMSTQDAFRMSLFACAEGLTQVTTDMQLVPLLAESWEQVGDLHWNFKLREGITFQDGAPLNADAVVTALNYVLNAPVPAVSFSPTLIASITEVDDMTVQISTQDVNPLLPNYLATPYAGILSPVAYSEGRSDPFGTCTGPFTFVSETQGQSLTAVRNENYWGDPAKIDRLEIAFVTDPDTRTTLARGHQVDLAFEVPFTAIPSFAGDDRLQLITQALPRHLSMIFNTSRAPLDNPQVRRAIQMSMDLNLLADGLYEGMVAPATGPFAPDQPWKSPNRTEPLPFDLDGAKALLAEAGVDPSTHTLDIAVPNNYQEYIDNSLFVQQSLQNLGFESTLRLAPAASLQSDLVDGNFDLTPMSRNVLSVVSDPIGYFTADMTCEGTFNRGRICIPELDEMISNAASEADEETRYRLYGEIEDYVIDNALHLFLAHVQQIDVASTKVSGYEIHPLNYHIITTDMEISE